jgi:hypothetical protein
MSISWRFRQKCPIALRKVHFSPHFPQYNKHFFRKLSKFAAFLQSKIREKSVLPTGFKAFKITIGDFEEDINLRGTTSFSLIKTPFAYKQIKAR